MTAPIKPNPDKDAAKVYVAATLLGLLGKKPLGSLTRNELEDLESAAETVLFAAHIEVEDRQKALRPRGAGHLRLAAAHGELTAAGLRSLQARKASRARWRRPR